MPSDVVLDRMRKTREAFLSALAATQEQVRGMLSAQRRAGSDADRVELGEFAGGRIDVERFSALLSKRPTLDPGALERIEAAAATLAEVAGRGEDLFRVAVPPGVSLVESVAGALAAIGRSYGAARVVELARLGRYRDADHASFLAAFPFARWSSAERRLAPPLLVDLEGRDLAASGLASFLDGSQKILLRARGSVAPAPLARLITPGIFVMQEADDADLARFLSFPGPGVAAILDDGAARFVHDPLAGDATWKRIRVDFLPERPPATRVGGMSAWQQTQDLLHLRALAEHAEAKAVAAVPAATPVAIDVGGGGGPGNDVDRLASWLLAQANLPGVS